MPIVPALRGGYRKEGKELKVILDYIVNLVNLSYVSQKIKKQNTGVSIKQSMLIYSYVHSHS